MRAAVLNAERPLKTHLRPLAAAECILRILFIKESQYISNNDRFLFPTSVPTKKEWKELINSLLIYQNNESGIVTDGYEEKIGDLFGYEVYVFGIIRKLREIPEYRELLECYVALKYITGVVCNDRTKESNTDVGFEMLLCLDRMGNKYAEQIMDIICKRLEDYNNMK